MSDHFWSGIITVATAIVGVAILAVIVSNQAKTSSVISAATGGFATDLLAAVSPVTGNTPQIPSVIGG